MKRSVYVEKIISYTVYHLATILKFTNLGVNRLGIVYTVLEKSFTSK